MKKTREGQWIKKKAKKDWMKKKSWYNNSENSKMIKIKKLHFNIKCKSNFSKRVSTKIKLFIIITYWNLWGHRK